MRLGTAALTLAAALSVVGMAYADEPTPGNWFTNLFARPAAKTPAEAEKAVSSKDELSKLQAVAFAKKRKADLDRRQEVCLRLREIAHEAGDEELMRIADDLDQRAWDTYIAGKNRARAPERSTKGDGK
jgi:hypothetical protein